MTLKDHEKSAIKRALVDALSRENEVRRIVIFGSFLSSDNPNDMDIAVFQDSQENYLPLALRYRKDVRSVSSRIPVDIVPLKIGIRDDPFVEQVEKGETIYER